MSRDDWFRFLQHQISVAIVHIVKRRVSYCPVYNLEKNRGNCMSCATRTGNEL